MNGGEVVTCTHESGCGESFEVLREYQGGPLTCPYCGQVPARNRLPHYYG